MPLILAIAPDRQQALRVAALAPAHVSAEVVIVESVDAALGVLDQRTPDLVLTPLLVSAKDDAALTARLRGMSTGDHELQTLVTPLLADETPRGGTEVWTGSLLGRMRKKRAPAGADGCDPAVFATQINEYLARSAAAREELRAMREEPVHPVVTVQASAPMLQEWLTATEVRTPRTLSDFDAPLEREFRAALEFVPVVGETSYAEPAAVNLIEPDADASAAGEREAGPDRHAGLVVEPLASVSEPELVPFADERLADAPVDTAARVHAAARVHTAARADTAAPVDTATPVDTPLPPPIADPLADQPAAGIELATTSTDTLPVPPRRVRRPGRAHVVPETPPATRAAAAPDIFPAVPATATSDTLPAALTPATEDALSSVRTVTTSDALSSVRTIPTSDALSSPRAAATSDVAAKRSHLEIARTDRGAEAESTGEVVPAAAQQTTPLPAPRPKRPRTPRPRRPAAQRTPAPRPRPEPGRPLQDEWGLYDPEQCGFAALLDRLEQITEAEPRDTGRERRSAIMRR